MKLANFHLHSEFSFLNSLLRIEKTALFLRENGFSGFVLTDTLSTYGFEQLRHVCKKYSLKAVFGLQIFVNGIATRSRYPILLISLNRKGLENLFLLNTIAHENFCQKGSFSISFDTLKRHSGGIAVLLENEILNGNNEKIDKIVKAYQDVFGENFYVEVNYTGEQKIPALRNMVPIIEEKKLNGIATCEARYERLGKALFDILINFNKRRGERGKHLEEKMDFSLKNMEEMLHYFKNHPDYLLNSERLLEKVEILNEKKSFYLPPFPDGLKKLRSMCEAQIKKKNLNDTYKERLLIELSEIENRGLENLFLLARDISRFLKIRRISSYYEGKNISYSLVAYLLKITHLDPVQFDFPFDFFIDSIESRRISLEWKVCWKKKKRVFPFLSNKYGKEKTIFLAHIERLHRRFFLKHIQKKKEIENLDLEKFLSLIEEIPFKAEIDSEAFLFFPEKIISLASIEYSKNKPPFVQMTQRDAEGMLLPPIVLSSSREISVLKEIKRELNISEIPKEDVETFKTIAEGNTTCINSLESYGIRNFLNRARPDSFSVLIDILSVYREGAFKGGLATEYLKRRSNHLYYGKISPKAHETHPVTWDTYGLILYEEQIHSIIQDAANLDKKITFRLLKAMKEKDSAKLIKLKPLFIEGCIRKGADENIAQRLFAILVETAPNTISKVDISRKAFLAYELAYLKTHYKLHFYIAVLNNYIDSKDHLNSILFDMKFQENPLEILPVDINLSKALFSIEGTDKIRAGLLCVKGLTPKNAALIIAERNLHGPYEDLSHFLYRISGNALHEKTVEYLIKSKAFSQDPFKRAALLKELHSIFKAISTIKNEKGQGLFNKEEELNLISQKESRAISAIASTLWEYEATGLYLTLHPLEYLTEKTKDFTVNSIKEVNSLEYGTFIIYLFQLKRFTTRKGIQIALGRITDLSGIADIAFTPEIYKKYKSVLKNYTVYLVKGKVKSKRLFVDQVFLLEEVTNLQL